MSSELPKIQHNPQSLCHRHVGFQHVFLPLFNFFLYNKVFWIYLALYVMWAHDLDTSKGRRRGWEMFSSFCDQMMWTFLIQRNTYLSPEKKCKYLKKFFFPSILKSNRIKVKLEKPPKVLKEIMWTEGQHGLWGQRSQTSLRRTDWDRHGICTK